MNRSYHELPREIKKEFPFPAAPYKIHGMGILWLLAGGFAAGFMDAIAGGGGLITLPLLTIALEPGVVAVASNKIVGLTGALVALLVYARRGHLRVRLGLPFVAGILGGSFLGSMASPFLPKQAFLWLVAAVCPLLLYVVWRQERWVQNELQQFHARPPSYKKLVLLGVLCGFYDGALGPGGGTFMFLALLIGAHFPLLPALAVSKLANVASAGTAFVSYALQGYVRYKAGAWMALGMSLGAFAGAQLATRKAERVVRPMLTMAVVLLLLKLFFF